MYSTALGERDLRIQPGREPPHANSFNGNLGKISFELNPCVMCGLRQKCSVAEGGSPVYKRSKRSVS